MYTKQLTFAIGAILGSFALSGCDLDVPDLNNPGLEQLENDPTVSSINTATTGLLIGQRGGKAGTTGLVNQLGILGRESYDFDPNDGRFVSEELQANLVKNSAFGGVFWAGNYANIRLGNIILHGVDKVGEFSEEEKAGIKGVTHTIQALELLTVVLTHESTGAVIDTDHPLGDPLKPLVPRDEVYTEIARLLDLAAKDELPKAGDAFSFALSAGYKGFDTPATFIKFNRAIKTRVAVYQASLAALKGNTTTQLAKYNEAKTELAASFINDTASTIDLKLGVNYVFSTAKGDVTNGLISTAIYAHPTLLTDAQKQADGTTLDLRYTSKTTLVVDKDMKPITATSSVDPRLSTTIKFKLYTNATPIPIIRNEELFLLKAEILWFTGDQAGAVAELNLVRDKSGKLLPLAVAPTTDKEFVDALLLERRYSLMFEGGHRWIDLRRFGRDLPLDAPDHVRNVRYPVPQGECDARPGEPACLITSTDVIK
jgi:starch-binding outer membrane protein, SusD/RagB family